MVEDEDDDLPKVDQIRVLKMNGPEWLYMTVGGIASVVMGASMPVYAILFGEVRTKRNHNVPKWATKIVKIFLLGSRCVV